MPNPSSTLNTYLVSNSVMRLNQRSYPTASYFPRSENRRILSTTASNDVNAGNLSPSTCHANIFNKQRYSSRKLSTNRDLGHNIVDIDVRYDSNALRDTYFNPNLRRILSANNLKIQQNSGYVRGGNVIQSDFSSLHNTSSGAMKVTTHKTPLELSVISGPAPISYKNTQKTGGHSSNSGR